MCGVDEREVSEIEKSILQQMTDKGAALALQSNVNDFSGWVSKTSHGGKSHLSTLANHCTQTSKAIKEVVLSDDERLVAMRLQHDHALSQVSKVGFFKVGCNAVLPAWIEGMHIYDVTP